MLHSSNSNNNAISNEQTSTSSSSYFDSNEDTSSSPSSSSSTIITTTTYQKSAESLRAGEDGYSILRRPVTFDANVDPTFNVPKVLDENVDDDDHQGEKNLNKAWFDEKKKKNKLSSSNNTKLKQSGGGYVEQHSQQQQQQQHRQNEEDQQLDMFQRTMDTLDYPLVLRALSNECGTIFGKELVLNSIITSASSNNKSSNKEDEEEEDVLTMPLTAKSVHGVHHRYGAVQEMQRLMEGRVSGFFITFTRKNIYNSNSQSNNNKKKKRVQKLPLGTPPISGSTFDLQPILSLIDEGKVLEGPEILDVTNMLELSLDVLDWCDALYEVNDDTENDNSISNNEFVELPKLVKSIEVNDELYNLLYNAFDDEGKLDGVTFPTIGRLRAKVRTYKRDILSSIDGILSMPSMKSKLAVESGGALTMEINGRLVIPVRQEYQNSVGIVHDASRSGKTCYVEPSEIVGPTNELRQVEAELRSEEAKVWRQLTEMIIKHRVEIERNVASLGQLDVVMARVKLGKRLDGVVPTVSEEGVVSVKEARHPILLLRELDNVVGSDVDIGSGDNQGLILTGPNSGGKTIILVRRLWV